MIKMASAAVETICFQDEIPVILSTSLELETYSKSHHVYKEVWTPEVGEKLNVLIEPEIMLTSLHFVSKKIIRWSFEEKRPWKVQKDDFLLPQKQCLLYCNCYAEISGKRCNLKDREGLQVPCNRHFSHVTKSHIFKNLNLRKKADRNFCGTFLKNRFRHLKLYSNPPS